ncbi:enoyl-CoA hydratase/isomerase family protein [Actinoplanes bogorensis]|uniref:3-hydroxyisobutyryl-CoA hydrolase n=1 Tax=Paractinoplanes bogorensis TaxID=1610840 RepID=A0ABS5YJJ8_9ACTN|nr:enoyl-CoA hydratase/isomerase family protein [Actinoplanes bogorensis]MBU2663659.1 enoyl-CoA hydratase/isomerase family protein [Actinoplanes bogorensis]
MNPVIAQLDGHLGHLILNRPRVINALTAEMVTILHRTLDEWATDDRVRTVLITGAGERGLCAGGDIRAIHHDAVTGGTESLGFWADEYRLNAAVAAYPKPVVAWMDGLVMGGGIGVSGHASLRLVTERSRLAMPEVGIGFHPDVGGSWLLGRAPGHLGTHLALTGGAIGAADGITAGLADHFVPASRLADLVHALAHREASEAVESFATVPPPGSLAGDREWIDECYSAPTVAGIIERLAAHPAASAQAAAKEIATKSPSALLVTLRSVRTAPGLGSLTAALEQELRIGTAMLHWPDFAEGIRAQIIDKDRRPRWSPPTLAEVPPELVDACFEPG